MSTSNSDFKFKSNFESRFNNSATLGVFLQILDTAERFLGFP